MQLQSLRVLQHAPGSDTVHAASKVHNLQLCSLRSKQQQS